MAVELRRTVLLNNFNRSSSNPNLCSRAAANKIPVDLKTKAGGSSVFAKAVRNIVLAKKFTSGTIKSREETLDEYRQCLKPNFSGNYMFSYCTLVDAAIHKYSPRLATQQTGHFAFPENEVDVCQFPQLVREYTTMRTLKERDKTSPERRVTWADKVNGKLKIVKKSSSPRGHCYKKGTGYSSRYSSRPVSRESCKSERPRGYVTPRSILKSLDNLTKGRIGSSRSTCSKRPGSSNSRCSKQEDSEALPLIRKEYKKYNNIENEQTAKSVESLPKLAY